MAEVTVVYNTVVYLFIMGIRSRLVDKLVWDVVLSLHIIVELFVNVKHLPVATSFRYM
jgi:hypothetical protein